MNGKVLFVGHSAGRSGAPILLLHLLEWLRANTDVELEILLDEGGSLVPRFEALGPTRFCVPFGDRRIVAGLRARARQIGLELGDYWAMRLGRVYKRRNISLVYSNTITNGVILSRLAGLECPVICHVHELDYWIHLKGKRNLELMKQQTTHYIAVSEAVKRGLVERQGIAKERVNVVHEFIPTRAEEQDSTKIGDIRESNGIPPQAIVVGGSGHETWRKGKDLFIQLAIAVKRRWQGIPIHFIWFGGHEDDMQRYRLEHDIRCAGLAGLVHFVGEVSDPINYHASLDIFAMVSREDPFPLVCLEAASVGKPVVCFDGAGGVPEFVEDDAGFVVPYLDVAGMADAVIALAGKAGLRESMGMAAMQKVRDRHDVSAAAPEILQVMRRFLQ